MEEVPFETILHSQCSPVGDKFHEIDIVKESVLGELYGEKITVNSFHHQSIKDLGQNLEVIAISKDGIIEAVRHIKNDFVIGVLENAEAIFGASGQIIREGGTHCTQMAFK